MPNLGSAVLGIGWSEASYSVSTMAMNIRGLNPPAL